MANTNKKEKKNVKKIVAAALVFVLGSALFINWYLNSAGLPLKINATTTTSEDSLGEAQYVSATTAKNDYFKEARLKREKTRDATMSELNKLIDSDKATSDEKKKAVETYSKLSERASTETDIETLICSKGVSVCIVVLGDKSAEVIIPENELGDSIVLQIKEIVTNKAGTSFEQITVSGAKN